MIGIAAIAGGFAWLLFDQGVLGLAAAVLLACALLGAAALSDRWR